eukprot:1276737-Rhodomonas_salina.3
MAWLWLGSDTDFATFGQDDVVVVGFFDAEDHADAAAYKKVADAIDDVSFAIATKKTYRPAMSLELRP